jgi:hypothetical protein
MRQVARTDPLVLFIGAGVSASRGLPQWSFLLRRLVSRGARTVRKLTRPGRKQFVDELLEANDPTILGSVVRRFFPSYASLWQELHKLLYTQPDAPLSLAFVHAVCRLILVRRNAGLDTLVVTTNYDDVLEHAFRDDPFVLAMGEPAGHPRVFPVFSEETMASVKVGDLVIYHIHGFVPNQDKPPPKHDIILSARDYGTDWPSHWTHKVLAAYWDAQWLFVGMSFHDPHISFILAERQRHTAKNPPIGIFSLQGQPWLDLEEEARKALMQAEVARLTELGMAAQHTNYFFEDSQFLHEVCLLITKGRTTRLYDKRRQDWGKRFRQHCLHSEGSDAWKQYQDTVHGTLVGIRDEIEDLASEFAQDAGEHYKVELWYYDHDAKGLGMLGTSHYPSYQLSRAARFPLVSNSKIAAVAAFTRGGPHAPADEDVGPTRWRYYLGAAVRLTTDPWAGLAVGALVIASSVERKAATVYVQRSTIEQQLENWMELAKGLLEPPP